MLGMAGLSPGMARAATQVRRRVQLMDVAGRTVAVDVPVRRVVLGEGRLLYLTAALESADPFGRIVAWRNDLQRDDPDTYRAYRARFPSMDAIPRLGSFADGTFSIEQVIALQPDVVVLNIETQRLAQDSQIVQTLHTLGIPVLYVDFRYDPLRNTDPSMRLFGTLFGQSERAEAFLRYRQAQIDRVTDVIAAHAPARPGVFIERIGGYTEDCCLSFGDGNFGRFVEMAGGTNLARPFIPGTFGQLRVEQVIAADPEVIIVTSANWHSHDPHGAWIGVGPGADLADARRRLAGYADKPAYRHSRAVRDGRLYAIWHQFYNSPYQFVAIQQMAKWLHPDLFRDLDPDQTFRAFHDAFLPVPYQPGYFVGLTQEASHA